MSETRLEVRDPRVDHTEGTRPAVRGGECSSCLHQPPLHEKGCAQLTCRAPMPCGCWKCVLKATVAAAESAEQALEDQDIDGCHEALARAGVSAGALLERVEDVIAERDSATEEAERLRGLLKDAAQLLPDRQAGDLFLVEAEPVDHRPDQTQADRIRWRWWRIKQGLPTSNTPADMRAAVSLDEGLLGLEAFLLSIGKAWGAAPSQGAEEHETRP